MDSVAVTATIEHRQRGAMTGFKVHLFSLVAALAAALAGAPASAVTRATPADWVSSWASSQIIVEPKDALPPQQTKEVTLRQLVRLSIGGSHVRIRLSNAMGTSPLEISGVSIARARSRNSSRIDPSTIRKVTFAGADAAVIPAGAEYVSDRIELPIAALATLAVSIRLSDLPKLQTGHPGSRATSYFAPGDQLTALELRGAGTVDHWYFLSGVDVAPESPSSAIAIVGDSITDGHGVMSNSDSRWTDTLSERLRTSAATRALAVLNLGIGSNCLAEACVGPSAVARLERDVLARNAVRYLIILEGVNDLGTLTRDAPVSGQAHRALVQRMIGALAQMSAQAREHGIKVIGGTILPYGGSAYYHPDAANEADRRAVNEWIRTPGNVDALVDFDALMRDPAQPHRLRREFDSGDGLHPSAAGYRFMAEAVQLALLTTGKRR
jgi:lysophospholipase L1-like esterase